MISFLYILLLIVSVLILVIYLKKGNNLLWSVFFSVFILYYVFVPTVLNISHISEWDVIKHTTFIDVFLNATEEDLYRVLGITVCVMLILILTHFILSRIRIMPRFNVYNYVSDTEYKYVNKIVYTLGIIMLIIGGLSLIEVMIELGGLGKMISLGKVMREYSSNNANYLSPIGAVCTTLSACATGSFFCIYSSMKKKRCIMCY